MDIIQIISTLGFPIACCLALGWYVKMLTGNFRDDIKEIQKEHKDEIAKVTDALNSNTIVIQKLCDKLEQALELV